jgi:hypothetical protein
MSEVSTASSTAELSRLAGALLLSGDGAFFLIGNTKEPCDWAAAGFERPAEGAAATLRVRRLESLRTVAATGPDCLSVRMNGHSMESIAEILANRLLIHRNASFSERLWRILTGASEENPITPSVERDVSWLLAMPERVWEIVREAALKCL